MNDSGNRRIAYFLFQRGKRGAGAIALLALAFVSGSAAADAPAAVALDTLSVLALQRAAQEGKVEPVDCIDSLAAILSSCPERKSFCDGQSGGYTNCTMCILARAEVRARADQTSKDGAWLKKVYGGFIDKLVHTGADCSSANQSSTFCQKRDSFRAGAVGKALQYHWFLVGVLALAGVLAGLWLRYLTRRPVLFLGRHPVLSLAGVFALLWFLIMGVDVLLVGMFSEELKVNSVGPRSALERDVSEAITSSAERLFELQDRTCGGVSEPALEDEFGDNVYTLGSDSPMLERVWGPANLDVPRDVRDKNLAMPIPKDDIVSAWRFWQEPTNRVGLKLYLGQTISSSVNAYCLEADLGGGKGGSGEACKLSGLVPDVMSAVLDSPRIHHRLAILSAVALLLVVLGRFVELEIHRREGRKTLALASRFIGAALAVLIVVVGLIAGYLI